MKTLIVVDMQNDFLTGALGTDEAVAIIPRVKEKISRAVADGDDLIFTRDTHGSNYMETQEGRKLPVVHCISGSDGWKIHKDLDVPWAKHVDKGAFGYPRWYSELDNPDEIELVGVCTDICVVSNALILKALFPETEITVDASCCAGVTPEKHRAALETMKSCQITVTGDAV